VNFGGTYLALRRAVRHLATWANHHMDATNPQPGQPARLTYYSAPDRGATGSVPREGVG
jgi:hypothetical protein